MRDSQFGSEHLYYLYQLRSSVKKNLALSTIISILIPGLGHIWEGYIGRGIYFFLIFLISVLLLLGHFTQGTGYALANWPVWFIIGIGLNLLVLLFSWYISVVDLRNLKIDREMFSLNHPGFMFADLSPRQRLMAGYTQHDLIDYQQNKVTANLMIPQFGFDSVSDSVFDSVSGSSIVEPKGSPSVYDKFQTDQIGPRKWILRLMPLGLIVSLWLNIQVYAANQPLFPLDSLLYQQQNLSEGQVTEAVLSLPLNSSTLLDFINYHIYRGERNLAARILQLNPEYHELLEVFLEFLRQRISSDSKNIKLIEIYSRMIPKLDDFLNNSVNKLDFTQFRTDLVRILLPFYQQLGLDLKIKVIKGQLDLRKPISDGIISDILSLELEIVSQNQKKQLFQLLNDLGCYSRVIELFSEVDHTVDTEVYYKTAVLKYVSQLKNTGDHFRISQAKELLTEVLELYPDFSSAKFALSQIYLDYEQYQQAEQLLLNLPGTYPEVSFALTELYLKQQRFGEARQYLQSLPLPSTDLQLRTLNELKALTEYRSGDLQSAFQTIFGIAYPLSESGFKTASEILLDLDDFSKMWNLLEEYRSLLGKTSEYQQALLKYLLGTNQNQAAIQMIENLRNMYPDDLRFQALHCQILSDFGQFDIAKRLAETISDPMIRLEVLTEISLKRGNLDDMKECLNQISPYLEKPGLSLKIRAVELMIQLNQSVKALAIIRQIFEQYPSHYQIQRIYRELAEKNNSEKEPLFELSSDQVNDYKLALLIGEKVDSEAPIYYQRAIDIDSERSEAYQYLGDYYFNMFDYRKAYGYYLKSLNEYNEPVITKLVEAARLSGQIDQATAEISRRFGVLIEK